jgi:hypothetical protein
MGSLWRFSGDYVVAAGIQYFSPVKLFFLLSPQVGDFW